MTHAPAHRPEPRQRPPVLRLKHDGSRASAKDPSIETLRGLAIVLLVVFHATSTIILSPTADMRSASIGTLDMLCELVAPLRMPLFTVISGYVYAMRPMGGASIRRFMQGKARRLLLPLLTLATLTFFIQIGPGRHWWWGIPLDLQLSDLWRIHATSYGHFWFLQAILLVFVVVAVVESRGGMSTWRGWLRTQGVAGALYLVWVLRLLPVEESTWAVFSLGGSLYLLPLFLLGLGLRRFPEQLQSRRAVIGASAVFVVAMAIIVSSQLGLGSLYWGKESVVGVAAGTSANLLLFRYRFAFAPLARVGRHSYAIYLFHHFGLLAGGGLAVVVGAQWGLTELVLRTGAGLLVPVIAWSWIRRFDLPRMLLLGLRPSSRRSQPREEARSIRPTSPAMSGIG